MADNELVSAFLAISALWAVTVVTPGPNFIATVNSSLTRSRRHGLMAAAGIGLGTFVWAAGSLLGLNLLFAAADWLYAAVKFGGAAYLIYAGIMMIRKPSGLSADGATDPATDSTWRSFRFGLLTDLANPKAAVFFTSLFAVSVPPGAPVWFLAALVAAIVAIAWGWYTISAISAASNSVSALYRRFARSITRLAGVLFVGFGCKLALDR